MPARPARRVPVSHPHPLWSEQNPRDWWHAATAAIGVLRRDHDLARVRGIGLLGQMHGAVLLDHADRVLRPAILWNDGRRLRRMCDAGGDGAAVAQHYRQSRNAGFHSPEATMGSPPRAGNRRPHPARPAAQGLAASAHGGRGHIRHVGRRRNIVAGCRPHADGRRRCWRRPGLDESHMPTLVEGSAVAGRLRANIAADWACRPASRWPVATGDNAAGAIGIGCIAPGQALVSLGTRRHIRGRCRIPADPIARCMRSVIACRTCGTACR